MTIFESINSIVTNVVARNEPAAVLRLEFDGAASLNLSAGEVVQLVGEGQKGDFLFDLNGRRFLLNSPDIPRKHMSDSTMFRVLPGAAEGKVYLQPLAVGAPAEPGKSQGVEPSGMMAGANAIPVETAFASLRRLVSPDGLSQISRFESCLPLLAPFLRTLIDPKAVTPSAVKAAFDASGILFEKKLAKGRSIERSDLKLLLTRLLGSGDVADSDMRDELASALKELEHAQMQVLAAESNAQNFVSLVLPTRNDAPIALSLFRAARSAEQPTPPFVVDMYLKSAGLGNVWCRTICEEKGDLSVFMCASSNEVVKAAGRFASSLERNLSGFGLRLARFSATVGSDAGSVPEVAGKESVNLQI